jgi:hypothetical protein
MDKRRWTPIKDVKDLRNYVVGRAVSVYGLFRPESYDVSKGHKLGLPSR